MRRGSRRSDASPRRPSARSGAMVGGAGEDRGGAVELLGEHHPRQQVRPDHAAERDQRGRRRSRKRRVEPVGAADGEGELAGAGVGGAAQERGEVRRGERAAALVERRRAARPSAARRRAARPRRPGRRRGGPRPRRPAPVRGRAGGRCGRSGRGSRRRAPPPGPPRRRPTARIVTRKAASDRVGGPGPRRAACGIHIFSSW